MQLLNPVERSNSKEGTIHVRGGERKAPSHLSLKRDDSYLSITREGLRSEPYLFAMQANAIL